MRNNNNKPTGYGIVRRTDEGASVVTNIPSFRRKSNDRKEGDNTVHGKSPRSGWDRDENCTGFSRVAHRRKCTVGIWYSETSKPNYVHDNLLLFSVRTKQLYCNIYAGRSARARAVILLFGFVFFLRERNIWHISWTHNRRKSKRTTGSTRTPGAIGNVRADTDRVNQILL